MHLHISILELLSNWDLLETLVLYYLQMLDPPDWYEAYCNTVCVLCKALMLIWPCNTCRKNIVQFGSVYHTRSMMPSGMKVLTVSLSKFIKEDKRTAVRIPIQPRKRLWLLFVSVWQQHHQFLRKEIIDMTLLTTYWSYESYGNIGWCGKVSLDIQVETPYAFWILLWGEYEPERLRSAPCTQRVGQCGTFMDLSPPGPPSVHFHCL